RTDIKSQIESFRPHSNRLEITRWNGIIILNDAYNANPDSMRSALRTLKEFPVEGRRIAALGDMFELGSTSVREHRSLGRAAAAFRLHHIFYTGKHSELAQKAARAASKTKGKHSYLRSKGKLADALREMLRPGDALLVKGSRGMKMEEVIDLLQRG
ncbi:MAG TPA: cyanophycin synthetase, partial [Candidatus Kapabacteria bacterium]